MISLVILSQCRSNSLISFIETITQRKVLCGGPDFLSDSEYFRANNAGESFSQSSSRSMALSSARAELADQVELIINAVIDNYMLEFSGNGQINNSHNYEGISREVIRQRLPETRIICEHMTRNREGRYITYIAIELPGINIINSFNENVAKDERLRADYNQERFKKIFLEEMKKTKNVRRD